MLIKTQQNKYFFECLPSYNSDYLDVGNGHKIYFEEYGNSEGTPVIFIHGGPGAGFSNSHKSFATNLMQAVGEVVWVENEAMIDAVTAVSGSGPAYLFHFVEALTAAAIDVGFAPDMAETFARKTIIGSAALLESSGENAAQLRENVTSKGGTTQAALEVLMADPGLQSIVLEAVKAAKKRSEELSKI